MAKTLVVKLAGTVDNDDLRKLGEIRIQIVPVSSLPSTQQYELTSETQRIQLTTNKPIQLNTTGTVHFTDSTLTQNLGQTLTTAGTGSNEDFYLSDGEGTLRIYDKYAVKGLRILSQHYAWTVNMWNFVGCEAMTGLDIHTVKFTENSTLEAFSGLHNLNTFIVVTNVNPGVKGNLASLSGLTRLKYLASWGSTSLYGDISSLAGLTNMISMEFSGCTKLTGDISSIAGLTNMEGAQLGGCMKLTGDTSSIAHLHPNNGGKLATFSYGDTGITGSWPPATA